MGSRCFVNLLVASTFCIGVGAGNHAEVGDAPDTIRTYSIGGTVTGAAGVLTLQNSNGHTLAVAADGAFTFGARMVSSALYHVTVVVPPHSQTCAVANGSGVVGRTSVSNVSVSCQ
jgi:hypothetical protein